MIIRSVDRDDSSPGPLETPKDIVYKKKLIIPLITHVIYHVYIN